MEFILVVRLQVTSIKMQVACFYMDCFSTTRETIPSEFSKKERATISLIFFLPNLVPSFQASWSAGGRRERLWGNLQHFDNVMTKFIINKRTDA